MHLQCIYIFSFVFHSVFSVNRTFSQSEVHLRQRLEGVITWVFWQGAVWHYSAQKAGSTCLIQKNPPKQNKTKTKIKTDHRRVTPHCMQSWTRTVFIEVFSECPHTLRIRIGNSLVGFVFTTSYLWVRQSCCCCPACHAELTWSRPASTVWSQGRGGPKYWDGGLESCAHSRLRVNRGWVDSWPQRAEGGWAGPYVLAGL